MVVMYENTGYVYVLKAADSTAIADDAVPGISQVKSTFYTTSAVQNTTSPVYKDHLKKYWSDPSCEVFVYSWVLTQVRPLVLQSIYSKMAAFSMQN